MIKQTIVCIGKTSPSRLKPTTSYIPGPWRRRPPWPRRRPWRPVVPGKSLPWLGGCLIAWQPKTTATCLSFHASRRVRQHSRPRKGITKLCPPGKHLHREWEHEHAQNFDSLHARPGRRRSAHLRASSICKNTALTGNCTSRPSAASIRSATVTAARVWHDQEPSPDHGFFHQVFKLGWLENYNSYGDCPNTKVTNCLREVFRIQPDPALLKYKLHLGQEALDCTAGYLERIGCRRLDERALQCGRPPLPGQHQHAQEEPQPTSRRPCCARRSSPPASSRSSSTGTGAARCLTASVSFVPGVHAGDIWGGFGSGDAERMTALIAQASLFAGIDSGPQKCAGATDTPAIGLWTGHHPIQFMDLCPNFLHLVPDNHEEIPPMQHAGPRPISSRTTATASGRARPDLADAASSFWPPPCQKRRQRPGQGGRLLGAAGQHGARPGRDQGRLRRTIATAPACSARLPMTR